jgi:hypothetical protein
MKVDWSQTSKNEMKLAWRTLKAAETLLVNNMHEDAVSRAYYAVLHAAKAALALRQQAVPSDRGIKALFEKLLVNEGPIETEFAHVFIEVQNCRESCDCDADFTLAKEGARAKVEDATRFLERIARSLEEAGDIALKQAQSSVERPQYRWRQGVLMHRAASNHRINP